MSLYAFLMFSGTGVIITLVICLRCSWLYGLFTLALNICTLRSKTQDNNNKFKKTNEIIAEFEIRKFASRNTTSTTDITYTVARSKYLFFPFFPENDTLEETTPKVGLDKKWHKNKDQMLISDIFGPCFGYF